MLRVPSALALSLALALAATVATAAVSKDAINEAAPLQILALDSETTINGVQVACTGIGETRNDPKWAAYPIRVEFSDAKNWYMADAAVALLDAKAHSVLTVRCDGPWVLLKPAPGTYAVYAQLMDSNAMPRSASFTVPKHGQKRVVLQFPDA
jgi:hypothetical protein